MFKAAGVFCFCVFCFYLKVPKNRSAFLSCGCRRLPFALLFTTQNGQAFVCCSLRSASGTFAFLILFCGRCFENLGIFMRRGTLLRQGTTLLRRGVSAFIFAAKGRGRTFSRPRSTKSVRFLWSAKPPDRRSALFLICPLCRIRVLLPKLGVGGLRAAEPKQLGGAGATPLFSLAAKRPPAQSFLTANHLHFSLCRKAAVWLFLSP